MSEERLEPSRAELVLRVASEDALARARRLGTVERLESAHELCVLHVRPMKTAREAWRAATRKLGTDAPLFPVLYDTGGQPHYPTGEVTIRFAAALSDSDLQHFCERHALRLLRRNEFVAKQVVCEPLEQTQEFLPDVVARLASQPGVRRAWANTLSRYRRATK